jgi:alkylresorcinol/alkylpyrone synthase
MATLLALERYLPPHRYEQDVVERWVRDWLEEEPAATSRRLLSVFAAAGVKRRASVVPIEEVFHPGDFETQNRRFREVDAHVANALGMGPRLGRLPITEAGCAGGVVGLARVGDHLAAHPDRVVLLLAVELSSLTFQRWDRSATNIVSTAIFGDGGAAAVLVGSAHPRAGEGLARVGEADSIFFPGTTHLMGFELRNQGLQIVLDRELAPFVRREIVPAVEAFLAPLGLGRSDIERWILHPGGRKVVEVMSDSLGLGPEDLAPTEAVLAEHGNMSSVTVLFVLDEILRRHRPEPGARGLLGAFGPGFAAELALLEFL